MQQKEINEKYQRIHECKQLLSVTDFHIIKHADPSAEPYEIPEEIVEARGNARAEINKLEAEIEVLEEELQNYIETIDEIEL